MPPGRSASQRNVLCRIRGTGTIRATVRMRPRPNSSVRSSSHRTFVPALFAASCGLAACTYPRTQVLVRLDSDAPAGTFVVVSATVASLGGPTGHSDAGVHSFTRGEAGTLSLPASFGIHPAANAPNDAIVRLIIAATFTRGPSDIAPRSYERAVEFRFVPGHTEELTIHLAISCTARTDGCSTVPASECSVARRCEELGRTCGDDGLCVEPTVLLGSATTRDASAPACDASNPSCTCRPGDTQTCYAADPATLGFGSCRTGTRTCEVSPEGTGGRWGSCIGAVMPAAETCNDADDDCDGAIDNGFACHGGATQSCDLCGFAGTQRCTQCAWDACSVSSAARSFEGNDPALGHGCGGSACDTDWCVNPPDGNCYIQYGPYMPLPEGTYTVSMEAGIYPPATVSMDVNDADTGGQLAQASISITTLYQPLTLSFRNPPGCHRLEFRLRGAPGMSDRIYGTTVSRTGP